MIQSLLAALPYLDEKKQEEAANHIANLSSNALVAVWSGPLVENRLPKVAAETLYDRLLNFAPDVSFPVLARIADLPSHPMRQETIDMFQILMDEPPPGGKWGDWIKAKRPSN